MKLATFFEKFDQFADAPGAVAKMRELVRHLAVTGKLVAQDPSDEHADKLIARIAEQRHAKKAKEYQPVTADDAPYELPVSWSWVRLGNISLTSDSGWSPQCLPESRTGTEWGVLKVSAVSWGNFKPDENKALPPGMTSRPDCEVKAGDFLLSRANTEELVARSVVVDQTPPRLMMSDKIVRFTFPNEIERAFINLANSSVHSRAYYAHNASGTSSSMKNIGREVMCNLPIAFPPLAEQKRIVAKVDELMALCDRLEAQQQERETRHAALARASLARFADAPTPANLPFLFHPSYAIPPADLRKSILTLAVQGKLVPQDPNDEPAARVLERIDAAPKRAMRTRVTDEEEGAEPTELEPVFELPPSWEWAPFRRLPLQASVGIDRGRSMQGPDKAVGYFKMNNIRNSGGVDLSDLTRIDATPDEVEAFALADGDFLFNTRNSRELVGKTCVFRAPSDDPVLYNNNILRVRFIEGFSPDFLDFWFRSPEGSAELEKLKSNTTNVCAIYQGKLSGFPCVIPPLAEQRRIVAKVEQLMALVDALETQLAASRATAANLLSALVAELTTKD